MKRCALSILLLAFTVACSGGGDNAATTSDTSTAAAAPPSTTSDSGSGCLPGTWTQPSASFSPKFVFNADGTGEETVAASQGGETRAFTWKMNGADKVTITFPAAGDSQASSTDWNVDCQNMKFASMYTKQ